MPAYVMSFGPDHLDSDAVLYIGRKLHLEPDLVIGKMYRLSSWLQHNVRIASGLTQFPVSPNCVDQIVGVVGFCALCDTMNLLRIDNSGKVEFDRWVWAVCTIDEVWPDGHRRSAPTGFKPMSTEPEEPGSS
jgi:hypothetical protein